MKRGVRGCGGKLWQAKQGFSECWKRDCVVLGRARAKGMVVF
jgi:hypothetical protein